MPYNCGVVLLAVRISLGSYRVSARWMAGGFQGQHGVMEHRIMVWVSSNPAPLPLHTPKGGGKYNDLL